MQTKIRNGVPARYYFSSVTSSIITKNERKQVKDHKCQYLIVTFAKILSDIKIVEKHKTRKNQQTFYKCNMWNNTIKITLYCITTRKATKGIKNRIIAVDGQGLANNYERQIQGQTNFRSTFVMLK